MKMRSVLALFVGACLFLAVAASGRPAPSAQPKSLSSALARKLQENLEHTAAGLDGVMGVYARDLKTGQTFTLNADRVFPQGSSIKIPILITLLRQDQLGRLHLSDRVTIRRSDLVGGSGVLQYFGNGTSSLALRDLAALMMVVSDNSATNLLIDRVGIANVNAEIRRAGLTRTRLERKMMDNAAERVNHENLSTPREMATLLVELYRGKLLDPAHTALALHLLEDYKVTPLRAGVPAGVTVADKPGLLLGVRCDTGLVLIPRDPYVLSVMTTYDTSLTQAQDAISAVSRQVYSYFDRIARSNSYGVLVRPAGSH